MKKFIFALAAVFMLAVPVAFAENVYLTCELETRPVTVNLQREPEGGLPNLRYDGIAYVPLDEYNCALMGITLTDSERALSIDKREAGKYSLLPSVSVQPDMSDMVTVVNKFVVVNGRFHDNAAMKYPFVTFNGVYYMPLYRQYIYTDMGWIMRTSPDKISIMAENSFVVPDGDEDDRPNPTGDYYTVSDESCVKISVRKNMSGRSQSLYLYNGEEFEEFGSNIFNAYDFNTVSVKDGILKINARHSRTGEDEKYRLTIDLSKGEISDIYYEGKTEKNIYPFETDESGGFVNEIHGNYCIYDGGHIILNGTMMRSYSVNANEKNADGVYSFDSPYWIMCEDLENYGYDVVADFENRTTHFNRNPQKAVTPLGFDGTDVHLPIYDSDWKIFIDGREAKLSFNIGGKALIYCGELGEIGETELTDGYYVMNVTTSDMKPAPEPVKNRVMGYYSVDVFDEPVEELQTQYLTDVIYAFIIPKADGSIFVPRPDVLKEVVAKADKDGCRVYASIGGGSSEGENILANFETIAGDKELTRKFTENCVWMIREYGLDGIEVDWESPTNATKDKYESFMHTLCGDERIESVSIAVSGSSSDYPSSNAQSVPDSVLKDVDFINIMAYGIYGDNHSPYSYAESSLDYWSGRGVEKEKLILGVPLFALPGWEQYRHLAEQGYDVLHTDYIAELNTCLNSRDTLVKKAQLAKSRAGGIMFFDIHEDAKDEKSASKVVFEIMQE